MNLANANFAQIEERYLANMGTEECLSHARKAVKQAHTAWNHKANASMVLKEANAAKAFLDAAIARLEAHCGD